ncbi:MAG: ATP-dependent helicase, partial [Corynebacterium sp.]|nr:ATP-dependent helicase [Corynebacterium sp.]
SVYAFRGASSRFLRDFPADHDIELTEPHRTPTPACISIVDSEGRLRDVVANTVRRRHLEDGVPWRDIAVIVRSTGDIGQMRRTLLAAGVPVHISPTDVVLAEQRLVSAVLLALRALEEDLSNSELEELLTGPVGGADPVTLRRLIRGLRRWDSTTRGIDSLRGLLYGELPDFNGQLTEHEYSILERVRAVLSAGRDALASGASVEEVLWAVWSATELDNRLQASALRGGATGSQADRDLDAMMALFDAAGDYV